jgi:hypothetical protein
MLRNIIITVLSVFLLFETSSNFLLRRKNMLFDVSIRAKTGEIEFLKEDIAEILNNEELEIESESFPVNPGILLLTINNDSVLLKDIIKNSGKLVFYYSDQYCDLCYRELLKVLNNYIIKSGSGNIIVLAEIEDPRSSYYLLKNNDIKTDIYLITKDIGFPAQAGKKPFFFMIDKSFSAKYVYIPYKKYLKNVETYISTIDKFLNGQFLLSREL